MSKKEYKIFSHINTYVPKSGSIVYAIMKKKHIKIIILTNSCGYIPCMMAHDDHQN